MITAPTGVNGDVNMKIRKIFLSLLAAGVGCIAAYGCGSGDSGGTASTTASTPTAAGTTTTGGAPPADSGAPVEVAFVTNNASDFWKIAEAGTKKAAEEMKGVTVDFKIPQGGTASDQKSIIDDLLAKGVKGIAISAIAPKDETAMLNDAAKKAVVFTQDSDAPDSDRTCYIGTDNVAAGKQAGEAVKKALPGGGKIMVFVGTKDAGNAVERYQGLTEALKGSNVTIIDERTDDADHTKAKMNAADTLVKYPDIAGMVGLWSYNGPAILAAVKDAGKIGKVKIVCFDEQDETLQGIKDGAIEATIVQQPFEFGYQAVKDMVAYVRGDKSVVPAAKKIIVPTNVIDKAGVDEFWTKLKQLKGKS